MYLRFEIRKQTHKLKKQKHNKKLDIAGHYILHRSRYYFYLIILIFVVVKKRERIVFINNNQIFF